MIRPKEVATAELLIWVTLGMSVVSAVIAKATGQIGPGMFGFDLVFYGSCAILPYKIRQGRNWARYAYAVIVVLGVAALFAGEGGGVSKVERVLAWVMLPIETWAVFLLFRPESTRWFEGAQSIE